ncbi:MAG: site-2 protease family protein [Clostridia bacterium]|nr:site-2 protease family protein [Clostridia bacterium]
MLRMLIADWNSDSGSLLSAAIIVLSYALLLFVMMPAHELGHAFAAYKLGDPTAKLEGRLTFNPIAHFDKIGTLMILLIGIGYAKPVPVNPRYFRNPNRDMALTALAGPMSNLLMAIASVGIFALIAPFIGDVMVFNCLYIVFIGVFASVNLGLMVFNLLPIHPFDGSRIFFALLPKKWAWKMQQYRTYISLFLFVIVMAGFLDGPLSWIEWLLGGLICRMFGLLNLF